MASHRRKRPRSRNSPVNKRSSKKHTVDDASSMAVSTDLFSASKDASEPYDDLSAQSGDMYAQNDTDEEEPLPDTACKTALPLLSDSEIEQATVKARKREEDYLSRLQYSYMSLSNVIFEQERKDGHDKVDDAESRVGRRVKLLPLFASVPQPIFESTLDGSLAHKHRGSMTEDICQYFDEGVDNYWHNESSKQYAPAIYIRPLTDNKGHSPTAFQFLVVIDKLQVYASGQSIKLVYDIDSAMLVGGIDKEKTKHGHRVYVDGKKNRLQIIYNWCAAVKLICHGKPKST